MLLLAGTARPELDPGNDGDGHQQPRGEQDVQDGQGDDSDEDQGNDGEHGDRSPVMPSGCVVDSRLPPAAASVDRDQPRFAPWSRPSGTSGLSLTGQLCAG